MFHCLQVSHYSVYLRCLLRRTYQYIMDLQQETINFSDVIKDLQSVKK